MSLIYGWIFPSGKILYCSFEDHLTLIDEPEFQEYFPEIKTIKDWHRLEEEMYLEDSALFEAQLDPEEHPAWHRFYARRMRDLLEDQGFYRFGTYKDSKDRLVIEIEGASTSEGAKWRDFVKKNFVVDRLAITGRWPTRYYDI